MHADCLSIENLPRFKMTTTPRTFVQRNSRDGRVKAISTRVFYDGLLFGLVLKCATEESDLTRGAKAGPGLEYVARSRHTVSRIASSPYRLDFHKDVIPETNAARHLSLKQQLTGANGGTRDGQGAIKIDPHWKEDLPLHSSPRRNYCQASIHKQLHRAIFKAHKRVSQLTRSP